MDIACIDIAAANIRAALRERQSLLQTKYNELRTASADNAFLMDVVRDYAQHLSYIKRQREAQYEAARKLKEYFKRLSKDTSMTEAMLRQTHADQKVMRREMSALQKEIDSIIVDEDGKGPEVPGARVEGAAPPV